MNFIAIRLPACAFSINALLAESEILNLKGSHVVYCKVALVCVYS